MRLFLSGIRKLVRRPATWVTFGMLIGLMALIFIAVGATADRLSARPQGVAALALVTFPHAYDRVLDFLLGLGGLLAVIYGAAIAGSEWTWGTLKIAVARGESRAHYMVAAFASVTVLLAVGVVLAFALGVVAAIVGATLAGVSTSGLGDAATLGALPEKLVRGWVGIVEQGALGFAIATLARSQLAGIGAGIALYFGEQFSTIFFPDEVRYLPFNAAQAVVGASSGGGFGGGGGEGELISGLSPDTALIVVLAWLIGAIALSALFTERAEIAG
jgi:ABC-type transport system involved in multi-copper enzyme maturation permease subunit